MYETEILSVAETLEIKDLNSISSFKIIKSGRNSKVFKFVNNNTDYIVKFYEIHSGQNRLNREEILYEYLSSINNKKTAKIIKSNIAKNFSLFSFLHGKKIDLILDNHIVQCANFLIEINNCEKLNKDSFPIAIDGIKKRTDHLKLCEDRLNIMSSIDPKESIEKEFNNFFKNKILVQWEIISDYFYKNYMQSEFNNLISVDELIISPSDFGFHNILLYKEELKFFDFEYAGLDDPIKLVCDFISHPDQNVSVKQINIFKRKIFQFLKNEDHYNHLVKIFLPFHQLKWCCIILNEFRSDKMEVRRHAGYEDNNLLQKQLTKSKDLFHKYFES